MGTVALVVSILIWARSKTQPQRRPEYRRKPKEGEKQELSQAVITAKTALNTAKSLFGVATSYIWYGGIVILIVLIHFILWWELPAFWVRWWHERGFLLSQIFLVIAIIGMYQKVKGVRALSTCLLVISAGFFIIHLWNAATATASNTPTTVAAAPLPPNIKQPPMSQRVWEKVFGAPEAIPLVGQTECGKPQKLILPHRQGIRVTFRLNQLFTFNPPSGPILIRVDDGIEWAGYKPGEKFPYRHFRVLAFAGAEKQEEMWIRCDPDTPQRR